MRRERAQKRKREQVLKSRRRHELNMKRLEKAQKRQREQALKSAKRREISHKQQAERHKKRLLKREKRSKLLQKVMLHMKAVKKQWHEETVKRSLAMARMKASEQRRKQRQEKFQKFVLKETHMTETRVKWYITRENGQR